MATIRRPAKPKTNYALISNDWLRDASLDWEARGLLAWLATHEHGFTVSVDDIVAAGTAGRDAVRRMLRKLVAAGYLLCRQVRDSTGKLRHALWQLSDPAGAKAQVKPSTGNPGNGADQAKHDVCPGQTVDWKSRARLPYTSQKTREDQKPSTRVRATTSGRPRTMPGKIEKVDGQRPLPGVTQAAMAARTDMLVRDLVDTITQEWLERCAKTPPSSIRQQVRAQIHALVVDGIAADDIRRGCARWMGTGLPPSTLPSEVNAVMNQTAPARRGQLAEVNGQLLNARTQERLAIVEHFEELERKAIGS